MDNDWSQFEDYKKQFAGPQLARAYVERFEKRRCKWSIREAAAACGMLSRLNPVRVLDVPCGGGRVLEGIDGRVQIVSVDSSLSMLGECRQRGLASALLCADAANLPFADGAFDTVFSNRLLHHLHSARTRIAVMKELARVSSKNVVVSFFDYSRGAALKRAWNALRGRRGHSTVVELARFKAEAARAGLAVESVSRVSAFNDQLYLVLRKEPAAAGMPLEKIDWRFRAGAILQKTWGLLVAGLVAVLVSNFAEVEPGWLWWTLGSLGLAGGGWLCAVALAMQDKWKAGNFTAGPFGFVRQPFGVGLFLAVSGVVLLSELVWMMPVAWVGMGLVMKLCSQRAEARLALSEYGHRFDDYTRQVHKWVPAFSQLRFLVRESFRVPVSLKIFGWVLASTVAAVVLMVFKELIE